MKGVVAVGTLSFFKKNQDPPKEVRKVFEKMARQMEGHRLADKAISYRNLGNFEKAFELLKTALVKYDYKPAITLIGTTAVVKGDIQGAIRWFSLQIRELAKDGEFPLIELYANLGSIYTKHLKDYNKAIQIYEKALELPRPATCTQEVYSKMVSSVHHDMAIVYRNLGDLTRARSYAIKRLEVQPDCVDSMSIIDYCDAEQETKTEENQTMTIANEIGEITGSVTRLPDGHHIINITEKSDFSSLALASFIVFADDIPLNDRLVFSAWAELPMDEWSQVHKETFAVALFHYFLEAKKRGEKLPLGLVSVASVFPDGAVPPLKKVLTQEVRGVFRNLFM